MRSILLVLLIALIALLFTVPKTLLPIGVKSLIWIVDICVISWTIVCGLVGVLAWAFGFTFTVKLATGVWILLFILNCIFKK